MSDMSGNAARVAVECGGRCRDTNHTSDILFENKDDQFRTGAWGSTVGRPNVEMSWSERINTAASGSGRVDDIKGHLQGEIRGPTKLVKMRGRDEMDEQPEGRECGMQSSQSFCPRP